MTNTKDTRLFGRHPEFSRCSTRAGIAYNYVEKMINSLAPAKHKLEDVPSCAYLFGKLMPLGRYIKNKIRLALWGFTGAPPVILLKIKAEFQLLYEEIY